MKANRRQFLTKGAAVAGLALGGVKAASAQTWTGQSPYMALTKTPPRKMGTGYFDPGKDEQPEFWGDEYPEGRKTPIRESFGIITPNREMFVANHQAPVPNIDASKHTLLIHGLVERPMIFTVDDIKRLPSVSRIHYLACAGNGGGILLGTRKRFTTVQQMYG